MAQWQIAMLDDRAVFQVTGTDANRFLQDLVTNDIDTAGAQNWVYTGLLTPQGKILFDFFVKRLDGGYLIDCAADRRDDLIARLTIYKLRAHVDISKIEEPLVVAAIWAADASTSGNPISAGVAAPDPRHAAAGARAVMAVAAIEGFAKDNGFAIAGPEAYTAHRLALGLPDTRDIGSGEHFVHECNFDLLNGVSFSKGCFVGQEVASRVEHRASARKRMIPVVCDGACPGFGAGITGGGKALGTLLSSLNGQAIALIRLDLAERAIGAGETLSTGDVTLTTAQPDWAEFAVPGARPAA